MVWPGPAVPVVIPRPTITLRPDKHPAAPGGDPSPNRLAVGDRLTLHATLSNVAPRLNLSQVWAVGSGPGQVAGASAGIGVRTPASGLPTGGRNVEQGESRTV